MTENEAIREIETSLELAEMCTPNRERDREITAYKMAIQALEEIQAYRAIGTVEEFKDLREKSEPKLEKLKEYEDLENKELLIRLPFSIGTEVYYVNKYENKVEKYVVTGTRSKKIAVEPSLPSEWKRERLIAFPNTGIGKYIFLNQLEAEQMLKQMKE